MRRIGLVSSVLIARAFVSAALAAALISGGVSPAAGAAPAATPAKPAVATTPTPLTTDEATKFAKDMTAKATAALTEKSLTRAKQLEKFKVVLSNGLALDVIGKFVIGDARKTMTPAQVARYDAAFPNYITKQYAEQFDEIVGRPLEVKEAKALKTGDVIVRTQFTRASGNPILVDWRVKKLKDGKLRMVDIIVQGVSIMLVKREEFASFVKQNGVEALLTRLEADAKSPA
jgi:phospholipid transport system substrate-binding protein